jgi:hypothetical protein
MTRPGSPCMWMGFKLAAAALLGLFASGCADKVATGDGDATETGNARIQGRIVDESGAPAVGAQVTVLPSEWNPVHGNAVPDSLKDTTDSQGRYRFTRLASGDYNLMALDPGTRTRSAVYGIELAADSVMIPKDTLHVTGALSVPLPETPDSGVGWIYVPGTQIRARVDSEIRIAGVIRLDSVPAGIMPSIVYAKGDSVSKPVLIADGVKVVKGELTYVNAFSTWNHMARLKLNTSGTGVAIEGDQRDFPLLVRLAAPEFDFSQASAGGGDLRFSKPDGTVLSREIETWDAEAGHAEIWVRLDTVHADDSSQSINMHWGRSGTAEAIPRRAVFDTLTGFAGVWHLAEDAADTVADGIHKDATGAGGGGNDRASSVSRDGAIGYGHGIDSGDYIVWPSVSKGLMLPSAFTMSVWYRTDGKGMGISGGDMVSVGDNYGLRAYKDSSLHFWYWPPVPPAGKNEDWHYINVKGADFTDGNWHLATGTFDGKVLRMYVDGKECGSTPAADVVGFQFPLTLTLGKHGNGKRDHEYRGDLDEVQIHSAVRGQDWIKLSYENQKPGSSFPEWAVP